MLRVSPSQKAMQDRISALQMQLQGLSGDPQAISDLTAKLATMQAAADSYPIVQSALSSLQSQVAAISVPDVSGLATKSALSTLEAKIPIVPDVSGLATKTALSAVESKIPIVPDISNLATKSALSTLESKIPDTSSLAAKATVDTLTQTVAAIKVPVAATTAPPQTDLVEQTGQSAKYAREDHTHKARIKRATVTIGTDGTAKWDFTEPFASIPVVSHMVQDAKGASRVNVTIIAISTTSVTVYADRLRTLPVLSPVTGILTAVITGVNTLVTTLSGLDLSGGPPATGVKVHLYAAEVTPS